MDAVKGAIKPVFDMICKTTGVTDGKLPIAAVMNWLKQSGILGKETGITESDVSEAHAKTAEDKEKMTAEELQKLITDVAKEKGMNPKELMEKLTNSDPSQIVGQVQKITDKFGPKFSK